MREEEIIIIIIMIIIRKVKDYYKLYIIQAMTKTSKV